MTKTHSLTPEAFTALAHGFGDPGAISQLRRAALSRHRRSIAGIVLFIRNNPEYAALGSLAGLEGNLASLQVLEETFPDIARRVLAYPQVGAWANSTLRDIEKMVLVNPELAVAHLAHLGDIVAAIALLAKQPFSVTGATFSGLWRVPALGSVATLPAGRYKVVHITSDGHVITSPVFTAPVHVPVDLEQPTKHWRPLARIRACSRGFALDVALDDVDAYAVDDRVGEPTRVSESDLAHWRTVFREAWDILAARHPMYAGAIGQGLQTLIPLKRRGFNEDRTATVQDAFGSILLTMPDNGLPAAETLVHEWQHAKLGGVERMYDLIAKADPQAGLRGNTWYAPWRDDPRPFEGLLQGVYAFLGVTDFWRVECSALQGDQLRRAQFQYSRWYRPTLEVLSGILSSGLLTPNGAYFCGAMQERMRSWSNPELPPDLIENAELAALDHHTSWQVRNSEPNTDAVRAAMRAWLSGSPVAKSITSTVRQGARPRESQARLDLVHLREEYPQRFARLASLGLEELAQVIPGVTEADRAFADGRLDIALVAYQEEIKASPLRVQSWVGLALTLRLQGKGTALLDHLVPVYALYQMLAVRSQSPSQLQSMTPEALAAWFAASRAAQQ